METNPKLGEFLAIALLIKELGFRVFINRKTRSYGFYSDGKNIGYFQSGTWSGVEIFTHNKYIINSPTGFVINRNNKPFHQEDITPELLRKAFVKLPPGAKFKRYQKVVKYDDLQEFLETYWDKANLIEV